MPVAGSSDSPTIEEQFASLDATGEIPVDADLGSGDETELSDVFGGDEPEPSKPADATAEIDLADLGLDLDGLDEAQISDLDETSESQALDGDQNLTVTGKNLAIDDDPLGAADATGTNFDVPEEKSVDDTDVDSPWRIHVFGRASNKMNQTVSEMFEFFKGVLRLQSDIDDCVRDGLE